MKEALTTPTAYDKTREVRELKDEMARLGSIKERAENETKAAVAAADEARNTLGRLKTEAEGLVKAISEASVETKDFIAHCAKVMREATDKTLACLEATKQIVDIADKANADVISAKKDAAEIHSTVVRDIEEIDLKRRDLDIYHARLKEHFEKHLPGQIIKL